MSDVERLQIAQRMNVLLRRELGEGIDTQRLVAQPLYARDVLLVCQALRDTDLPALAAQFAQCEGGMRALEPLSVPRPAAWTEGAAPLESPPALAGSDSGSGELPESGSSGWMASLWPSSIRGGLFSGRAKKRGPGKGGKASGKAQP